MVNLGALADWSSRRRWNNAMLFLGIFGAQELGNVVDVLWSHPLARIAFTVASVFSVEIAVMGWRGSSLRQVLRWDASAKRDAAYTVLMFLGLIPMLSQRMLLGLDEWWRHNVLMPIGWQVLNDYVAPGPWRVALYVVATDLGYFIAHRLLHDWRFWAFHEFHHSAAELSPLTAHRTHPVDLAVNTLVGGAVVLVLGGGLDGFAWVMALMTAHNCYIHSSIDFSRGWYMRFGVGRRLHAVADAALGWIGRWVFMTAAHHRLHHAMHVHDVNFAPIFVWWDRLAGTYLEPPAEPVEVGVDGTPYNRANGVAEPALAVLRWCVFESSPGKSSRVYA